MSENFAFFVEHPRKIDELIKPHDIRDEKQFEVVKQIVLSHMDYENFVTDMLVQRDYLEKNAALCGGGEDVRCLLVTVSDGEIGVLVVPDYQGFVVEAGCWKNYAEKK